MSELKAKAFDAHIAMLQAQEAYKKAEQYYVECANEAMKAEKEEKAE
jgi:hypothetical protein